jgi:hypothetical protein
MRDGQFAMYFELPTKTSIFADFPRHRVAETVEKAAHGTQFDGALLQTQADPHLSPGPRGPMEGLKMFKVHLKWGYLENLWGMSPLINYHSSGGAVRSV